MDKTKILVVDDIDINRVILYEILNDTYEVFEAKNGIEAIEMMFTSQVMPYIVLLDIMMPEMDGYEVLKLMRGNPATEKIPVIFITAANDENKGLSLGADDYISKPFDPDTVKLRVSHQIALRRYSESLESMVETKVAELMESRSKMLETMANIIEYRNLESGHHVKRTRRLTEIMIRYMQKDDRYKTKLAGLDPEMIISAVPLHDIGKIGIPDNILLKPAPLTKEEFEIIKTHTTIGSDIIESLMLNDDDEYFKYCRDICRYHHERWDGKGYPDKLAGEDIPYGARLLAIADVYDALVSSRVYKAPFPHAEAMKIIAEGAGTQFDPDLIDVVLAVEDQFEVLNAQTRADEEREALEAQEAKEAKETAKES